ncbi:MAG: L,D-transpeptidase family protein [Pseudomonadota bacterium]
MIRFGVLKTAMAAAALVAMGACSGPVTTGSSGAPAPAAETPAAVKPAAIQVQVPEAHEWSFADVPRYGRAILVNIPSNELIAFEDGKPVMRRRVITGKPATPTPVMETETSVVRFRPTWTPTPTMIKSGKYTPGTRPPGKRNPLGLLAIRLEPGMLIYLHGTNKPQLYDRENRALSHGCVRVERWDEVAAWVLETDLDDIHKRAYGRRTHDVQTDYVRVIIGYHTEFPDAEGVMQTYKDVYRRGTYAEGVAKETSG